LHRSNRFRRNEKEQSNNYCNECFVHDRGGKLMFALLILLLRKRLNEVLEKS
jgi:hypothetical protein